MLLKRPCKVVTLAEGCSDLSPRQSLPKQLDPAMSDTKSELLLLVVELITAKAISCTMGELRFQQTEKHFGFNSIPAFFLMT